MVYILVILVLMLLGVVLAVFGLGSPNDNRGDFMVAAGYLLLMSIIFALLRVGDLLEQRLKRK